MKKNVMLVTLWDNNQGNMLQRYALMTVLNDMGFEVTHVYKPKKGHVYSFSGEIKKVIKLFLGGLGVKKYRYTNISHVRKKYRIRRNDIFKEFYDQYFLNRILINDTYSNVNVNQFDYAICGSDQVWHNWHDFDDELFFYYLQFVEKNKRIAYAPSFGFSVFPEKDIEKHRQGIQGIKKISAREEKGAHLIEEFTNKKVPVVLDPTLLLSIEQWDKITRKPKKEVPHKYLFLYFLGNRTDNVKGMYETIAKDNDLDILDLSKREWYECVGPSEFVWLIKNANYVCTDSFHATVFSILYHKEFQVIKRSGYGYEDMFDRLENLLNIAGIEDRIFEENKTRLVEIISWNKVDERIKRKGKESLDFLKYSVNGIQ